MNTPAFLVEGIMEQKFIQSVCPGAPVRTIGCNGSSVKLDVIAKRVGTLARLFKGKYSPIVVIFDREDREEESQVIESIIRSMLEGENIDGAVVVGVPDRNIEEWILADLEMFSKSSGIECEQVPTTGEGFNCKSKIKKHLGGGRPYVETIHGVQWLKAARPHIMRDNSPSFSRLFSALGPLDCWWLKKDELLS